MWFAASCNVAFSAATRSCVWQVVNKSAGNNMASPTSATLGYAQSPVEGGKSAADPRFGDATGVGIFPPEKRRLFASDFLLTLLFNFFFQRDRTHDDVVTC